MNWKVIVFLVIKSNLGLMTAEILIFRRERRSGKYFSVMEDDDATRNNNTILEKLKSKREEEKSSTFNATVIKDAQQPTNTYQSE